jgi:hypothetical protein
MRIVSGLVVAAALVIGIAAAASAHNLTVTNPQTGEVVTQQWISGSPLPPVKGCPTHARGRRRAPR